MMLAYNVACATDQPQVNVVSGVVCPMSTTLLQPDAHRLEAYTGEATDCNGWLGPCTNEATLALVPVEGISRNLLYCVGHWPEVHDHLLTKEVHIEITPEAEAILQQQSATTGAGKPDDMPGS